jgi:DNA polymerase III epsilon subunit-like protein
MSDLKKEKPMSIVTVEFKQFTDWDFIPPGSYYIHNASGDYIFMKTSSRQLAQKYIDENYGKGKYTVIPSKDDKTKSKLESGGLSCTGTSTRRGQKR